MTHATHDTTGPASDAEQASLGIAAPRYRLPAATQLGHVRLQVADLERSLAYYERVLGFRVLTRRDGDVTLGAVGDDTPLVELHERRGATPAPQQGRLGLYHFAILLPDRPALGRFVAHLAQIGARAGASDHLVSEAIYLRDPDGLGIEVYADRPRESWRTVDRELQMDTTPLDLDSVVQAAGGVSWSGMPPGTRVGHVHLHVGDLEKAADFYHAALGLDKIVWSYPSALFLSAGGYHHHLGVNTWAGAGAPRPTEQDARLLEWRLETPGAERAVASLAEAGYAARATDDGWVVTDPWGTDLRLIAR
ncbi:MAG: VOC family protein [Gemmatimonadaceae bacterium]